MTIVCYLIEPRKFCIYFVQFDIMILSHLFSVYDMHVLVLFTANVLSNVVATEFVVLANLAIIQASVGVAGLGQATTACNGSRLLRPSSNG
jgi:hypothetical protein